MTLRRAGRRTGRAGRQGELSNGLETSFIARRSVIKNAFFPPSKIALRRSPPSVARWKRYQDKIDPKRLVFIDETWVKTNMAPLRGWCARGKRLVAARSLRPLEDVNLLWPRCAAAGSKRHASLTLAARSIARRFLAYVEQCLNPDAAARETSSLSTIWEANKKSKAVRDAIPAPPEPEAHLPPGLFARSEPD